MGAFQPRNSAEACALLGWAAAIGWSLIPLAGKQPVGYGWQRAVYEPRAFVRRNIGLRFGPPSLHMAEIDIDTDQPADIKAVLDAFKPFNPVLIGRDGNVRHCLFRLTGRPLETFKQTRKLAKLPYHTDDDKQAHLDWRLGGIKGVQSLVIGVHPSGQRLEFYSPIPQRLSDIPTIPYAAVDELWWEIVRATRAEYQPKALTADWRGDDNTAIDEMLPSMTWLTHQLTGERVAAGRGSNPCPICWDMPPGSNDQNGHRAPAFFIYVEDNVGKCWHDSCPSRTFAASSNEGCFNVSHVLAYHMGRRYSDNRRLVNGTGALIKAGKVAFPFDAATRKQLKIRERNG